MATTLSSLFLLSVLSITSVFSNGGDKLNVHLVPHTHNDVGWLKTVDEYYYGANQTIQKAGVQYILDTVMQELAKNPERKFIYVEIAFFYRWWNEQSDEMKDRVRKFVSSGQLEFINGGWCMNDEATTHYNAIIDQMTVGLKFIERTFGPAARPTIGWHIDPFGHSAEQANLFAHMGFQGFFLGRIHYGDKALRLNTTTMEMIWRGSSSLKQLSDIFTGVLYEQYRPPKGFCFDQGCNDDPIQDDPDLSGNNVDRKVAQFIEEALDQAKHYKTNNILMTMGEDFQYSNALMWFKNLDKLIEYVNRNGSINVMYSTPSIYLSYVNKANQKWTLKTDDFFPYADKPHAYWTGYFTSRPALKRYVRKSNNRLQVCKQLEAAIGVSNGFRNSGPTTDSFKKAVGVAQHHDAVAGTEKQHVADDYAKRLYIAGAECHEVTAAALNTLLTFNTATTTSMDFNFCEYLNISACPYSESGQFNLVVYNPLGRAYSGYIRFPLNVAGISAQGPDGKSLPLDVFPVSNSTFAVRGNLSKAPYEAAISLMNSPVPALGYNIYTIKTIKSLKNNTKKPSMEHQHSINTPMVLSNDLYQVEFSQSTGRISKITNLRSNISTTLDQQFLWYNASSGNNRYSKQASGAYIFRPNSSQTFPINEEYNFAKTLRIYKGKQVSFVEQQFAPWLSQVVRLYDKHPAIELEYTIGPIPFNNKTRIGKEIITRFDTDLKSESTFYTDANGREMQTRKRNYRPTWKYNDTEPVAGNYYPVNSRIYIKDQTSGKRQFTILTDRSQGGSSLKDGSIELMVHRRLFHDDKRGAGEALNEPGQYGDGLIIRGKHYLILDNETSSTYLHRMLGEELMLEPELVFTKTSSKDTYETTRKNYMLSGSLLQRDLPPEVHLLTFELLEPGVVLLRLDHQFESSDPVHNGNITVSLSDLFKFKITNVTELLLGANAALRDVPQKYYWNIPQATGVSPPPPGNNVHYPVLAPDYSVTLSPMAIRTFNVTVHINDTMMWRK